MKFRHISTFLGYKITVYSIDRNVIEECWVLESDDALNVWCASMIQLRAFI